MDNERSNTPSFPQIAATRQIDRIFSIVAAIPFGRVTTYGAIARAIGVPRGARAVGWALHQAGPELPCHRVVNRVGFLSGGWHFGHPDVMAGRLEAEGVPFVAPYQVDITAVFWLPEPWDEAIDG
ncbi:MAG: MGMT family protein [Thermomicrobiales bacterium]